MEAGTASAPSGTGVTTMAGLAAVAAKQHAGKPALRHKQGDQWVDIPYEDLGAATSEVARGLMDLGIERGDRVSILANTRPEWTFANLRILASSAASVSIYQTNSPAECHYVLHHSESRAVFVEDQEQLAKVREIGAELPNLEMIVVMEPQGDIGDAIAMDDLCARGGRRPDSDYEERLAGVGDDDMCLYIY